MPQVNIGRLITAVETCQPTEQTDHYVAYEFGDTVVKRSLHPWEYPKNPDRGPYSPEFSMERVINEAAALYLVGSRTTLPVPRVNHLFVCNNTVYLFRDSVPGVPLSRVPESQNRDFVDAQMHMCVKTLQDLKSTEWGGPTGIVIPPIRVHRFARNIGKWVMQSREDDELVFCHNDLVRNNIIVRPDDGTVTGIINWEGAGFFTPEFEQKYWRRHGPASPIAGEEEDRYHLSLKMLDEYDLEDPQFDEDIMDLVPPQPRNY